jgi:linoleoyl-CoA desaturase
MTENLSKPTALPQFLRQDSGQFRILQKKINRVVKNHNNIFWVRFKAILFPIFYVLLFWGVIHTYENKWLFFGGYFALGLFLVIIFLTVIHELSHDNVFKNKRWNRYLMYFFDLMGANSYIWKQRHQLMHHNYPNLKGWDSDLEQSSMFKIFPDEKQTWFHKHQHRLVFVMYPFYLMNWLLVRDFRDFFSKNRIVKKVVQIPKVEYFKLVLFKAFYFFYMLVFPFVYLHLPFMGVFAGFMILNMTASVFALGVLLPPHAAIQNDFPTIDKQQKVSETWLSHQLKTTSDIENSNWFTAFFMGNFNYHVAHHLFPNLSYIHLKEVTEIIADFAKQNGLPYKQLSFSEALHNHYKLLKANALHENVFEETF